MRVLFVLEDLRIGGAQRHSLALAAALRPTFTCEVLNLGPRTNEPLPIPQGVPVTSLRLRPLRPPAWPALAKTIAERRPDLIVAVNPVATLAVAAARKCGAPHVPLATIFHTTLIKRPAAWLRTAPFLAVARCCDALIYVSETQRRHWQRRGLGARRVEVILNGVSTAQAGPRTPSEKAAAKARLGWAPGDLVFGVAAAMRPEKNLVQLVDALAALRSQGLPARLLIVGDGPERGRVEARARATGTEAHLTITGLQSDATPFVDAMDVGVLPSTAVETLSLFALEAMARGTPMVMSDIGGASEIVTDDVDGRLFPAGDTQALATTLAAALAPETRERLSRAASETVRRSFDDARMTAAYATLFAELIAAKRSGP